MRFSLMTEPQIGGTYDDLLALARWAENEGMVSFARSDHYYYSGRDEIPAATDAFATLAGLARDTTTLRLGVLVSPITFRHPAVIAKTAATIDQMSGGRLDLGVGTGWMEAEHEAFGLPFPPWEERFARLEETLGYLEAAFGQGQGMFEGDHYRLDATVEPKPLGLRLLVGGTGPTRTPTLAGTHADEYNHIVTTADELAPKVATMRQAAETAGRDPSDIEVTMMGPVFTGIDEASFREALSEAAASRDTDPESLEERWKKAGIPMGPPERLAETLAGLEEVGVDRYYLQWIDHANLDGAKQMWAAVKASQES